MLAAFAVAADVGAGPAIAEWVADAPGSAVAALGMDPGRRPSEAMIRRLLQALDPDRLTAAVSGWLAGKLSAAQPSKSTRRAIAVDGKTLRVRHEIACGEWITVEEGARR